MKAPRDEIGNALIALKEKGYPIVAIDSDLASSTRTDQFQAATRRPSSKWALRKVPR
jgi:transketolase